MSIVHRHHPPRFHLHPANTDKHVPNQRRLPPPALLLAVGWQAQWVMSQRGCTGGGGGGGGRRRGRRVTASEIWELIKARRMNETFNGALGASGGSQGLHRNPAEPKRVNAPFQPRKATTALATAVSIKKENEGRGWGWGAVIKQQKKCPQRVEGKKGSTSFL